MMRRIPFLTIAICLISHWLIAQTVWTEPFFPEADDQVTVFFNAKEGDGGLAGFSGDVYAHTGVITSNSTNLTDWRYVKSDWGVADPAVKMTSMGNDLYTLSYTIRSYYGVPMGEEVLNLAFVFRNVDGSVTGRAADGSDLYTDVYQLDGSIQSRFLSPDGSLISAIGEDIEVFAASSAAANLTLTDNSTLLSSETANSSMQYTINVTEAGSHLVEFVAADGSTQSTSTFTYTVPLNLTPEDPPADSELGINYTSSTSVLLRLYAPNKSTVFAIGDFNEWQLHTDYQLRPSLDGNTFWIAINGLTAGEFYSFQYVVDGTIKTADPYSTLILDPANDGFIPSITFPNSPPYPTGRTTGICSVIQPGVSVYNWQNDDYERPEKAELVIYELLMRDFLLRHDYENLLDTLDYLQRLGVNAIELMPVNEFEGNDSWGYNPSYHMALDKYYGTPEVFKDFVDEAHARGIAVILDVVYNHAFSQSPLAQLYWDAANFRPSADNPWLNQIARHPFNVGYDFNHESQATKDFVDRVSSYWLEEYHIDGFRFDLSKGFTQKSSGDDVALWGQYDGARIAILKRIADVIWSVDDEAYIILEHFANNTEEKELADYGMMLWGNMNHDYNEASMGYDSKLSWGIYTFRGWDNPHLVTYMESHDEERMMYKNLQFGNSNGSYSVKTKTTALNRQELASAFFYTIPGPKMLWEFGELGYDFSINRCVDGSISDNCRLSPKPIRWDYYEENGRRRLYEITRALLHLRNNYEVFQTTDFNTNVDDGNNNHGEFKSLHLNHSSMNVAVLGNFNVLTEMVDPKFQQTGSWYEYLSGTQLEVSDVNAEIELKPGEYRLYTSVELPEPPGGYLDLISPTRNLAVQNFSLQLFPNPTQGAFDISYTLEHRAHVQIALFNAQGQRVAQVLDQQQGAGQQQVSLSLNLAAGVYLIQLRIDGQISNQRFVVY